MADRGAEQTVAEFDGCTADCTVDCGRCKGRPFERAVTEIERLREMLHRIVGSAYGETRYPNGRTRIEVSAEHVNAASRALGYTRRFGVE